MVGPFVRRVVLENYKSIAKSDVQLGSLVFLVGPNGSGKSNFIDALRFVAESLQHSMDRAFRDRGGIGEVRRRSQGHPTHFRITLELNLSAGEATYSFRVGAQKGGGFEVQEEHCRVVIGDRQHEYRVRDGKVTSSHLSNMPPAATDRLYLTLASGFTPYKEVYQLLTAMGFYSINPQELRDLQSPDSGELLLRDGSNAASVLGFLSRSPEVKSRIEQYLGTIVPGIRQVERKSFGHKETLEFKQDILGDQRPWSFTAQNMSDGTLRALGVLVAVFQCLEQSRQIPLVAIEEPETALHPAAAGVLVQALREASNFTQVLITSHSPDLLDAIEHSEADSLLIFNAEKGKTTVGPADEASLEALKQQLYTAGELLRSNQLMPRASNGAYAVADEEEIATSVHPLFENLNDD